MISTCVNHHSSRKANLSHSNLIISKILENLLLQESLTNNLIWTASSSYSGLSVREREYPLNNHHSLGKMQTTRMRTAKKLLALCLTEKDAPLARTCSFSSVVHEITACSHVFSLKAVNARCYSPSNSRSACQISK